MNLQAVILSAGMGTRMAELTQNVPKPMLPVNGKPLLLHQIEWLRSFGINEFFVNLYYLSDSVISYFGNGEKYGVKIHYSVEEKLMGTGGAYLAFRNKLNDHFLAVNCDVFIQLNVMKFYKFHLENGFSASMAIWKNMEQHNYSPIWIDGKKVKQIGGTCEGLPGGIFTGCHLLSRDIFDFLPKGPSSIMHEFYQKIIPAGKIGAYTQIENWVDLGTKELYQKFIAEKT